MKKLIALLTAVVLALSLCACGGGSAADDKNTEIETALNAGWIDAYPLPDTPYTVIRVYVFQNGTAVGGVDISTGNGETIPAMQATGTYEITEDKIIIDWTEIDTQLKDLPIVPDSELPYSYENSTLRLFSQDGQAELERQDLSA